MSTVIKFENLSKCYKLGKIDSKTFKEDFHHLLLKATSRLISPRSDLSRQDYANDGNHIWALKNLNLEIKEGEILGVIGQNGAGKSTFLKILSKITAPTTGRVKIKGQISGMLEAGTGFHRDLTGKENIYLMAAVLGMSREYADSRLDEIIDFAQIDDFLETPIKRYSTGMRLKLAFAVAAHLEPEILIFDEILATSDQAFQDKCIAKLRSLAANGHTILFVSHNMDTISQLCTSAILFSAGEIIAHGAVDAVIGQYIGQGFEPRGEIVWPDAYVVKQLPGLRLFAVRLLNRSSKVAQEFSNFEPINVEIEHAIEIESDQVIIGIQASSSDGVVLFQSYETDAEPKPHINQYARNRALVCKIPAGLLAAGQFDLSILVNHAQTCRSACVENVLSFNVIDSKISTDKLIYKSKGLINPKLKWKIKKM